MVGRPGRSKGCFNCRRRHLKCDETRPRCQRCQQAGVVCEGYRAAEFIIFDGELSYPTAAMTPLTMHPTTTTLTHRPMTLISPPDNQVSRVTASRSSSSRNGSSEPNVHRSPPGSGGEFMSHLHLSVFAGPRSLKDVVKPPDLIGPPWKTVEVDGQRASVAELALRAVCDLHFGQVHCRADILKRSAVQYGRALAMLNQKLSEEEVVPNLELMLAVTMGFLYEALISLAKIGPDSHIFALSRLFSMMGAETIAAQPAILELYEQTRAVMLLCATLNRKRIFTDLPQWRRTMAKTREWPQRPNIPSVLDIGDRIPGFLQKIDELKLLQSHSSPRGTRLALRNPMERKLVHELILEVTTACVELHSWRQGWKVMTRGQISEMESAEDQPVFSKIVCFQALVHGSEVLCHNAIKIALLRIASCLDMRFEAGISNHMKSLRTEQSIDPGESPLDSDMVKLHEDLYDAIYRTAVESCRCVEWQVLDYGDSIGRTALFPTLQPVYLALRRENTVEGRWLGRVMASIAGPEIVMRLGSWAEDMEAVCGPWTRPA